MAKKSSLFTRFAKATSHYAGTSAVFGAAMAGTVVIHLFGIVGFVMKGMGVQTAVVADMIFLPGDIIKNVLAVLVALSLHRAFPDLLVRRRK